jgi:hypothetical protein
MIYTHAYKSLEIIVQDKEYLERSTFSPVAGEPASVDRSPALLDSTYVYFIHLHFSV